MCFIYLTDLLQGRTPAASKVLPHSDQPAPAELDERIEQRESEVYPTAPGDEQRGEALRHDITKFLMA